MTLPARLGLLVNPRGPNGAPCWSPTANLDHKADTLGFELIAQDPGDQGTEAAALTGTRPATKPKSTES